MSDEYGKENAVYFQRLEDKLDKLLESVQQLNVGQAEQAKDTVQLQKEMLGLQRDLKDQKKDHQARISELEKVQFIHKTTFKKLWAVSFSLLITVVGAIVSWLSRNI